MQKIIYLYGPSCSGKSTIAKDILLHEKMAHVHYDILKWEIPNYSRDNSEHREQIQNEMLSQIDQKLAQGFSIVIEGLSCDRFETIKQQYKDRATFFSIKVTARLEVLEKRFTERLEQMKHSDIKISNTSLDVFRELFKKYNTESTEGITIDTSALSFSETQKQVKTYLGLS